MDYTFGLGSLLGSITFMSFFNTLFYVGIAAAVVIYFIFRLQYNWLVFVHRENNSYFTERARKITGKNEKGEQTTCYVCRKSKTVIPFKETTHEYKSNMGGLLHVFEAREGSYVPMKVVCEPSGFYMKPYDYNLSAANERTKDMLDEKYKKQDTWLRANAVQLAGYGVLFFGFIMMYMLQQKDLAYRSGLPTCKTLTAIGISGIGLVLQNKKVKEAMNKICGQ